MLGQLFSGLAIGSIYMLIALGFTLVLGIGNIVNLAHGSVVVTGMYTVYELNTKHNFPVYLAVLVAVVVGALVALIIYGVAIIPSFKRTNNTHRDQLVYTLLIMSLITAIHQLLFTGQLLSLSFEKRDAFIFLGVNIERPRLIAFIVAIIVTGALYAWLQFTTQGKLLRMTGKFTASSHAIGVPVSKVFLLLFVLGGALAGLAGGLLMTVEPVAPGNAFSVLIVALLVAIAGRLTFIGVGIAGILYGITQVVLNSKFDSHLATALVFIAFLLVLSFERVFSSRSGRRLA
jgi:branched-chain amino acid transport system permease protein